MREENESNHNTTVENMKNWHLWNIETANHNYLLQKDTLIDKDRNVNNNFFVFIIKENP